MSDSAIMPEILKKSSIIGRSPTGHAVLAFDNETAAQRWAENAPNHRITFFRQEILEQEIKIEVKA